MILAGDRPAAVVVAGPAAVIGPGIVGEELVSAALDCVDDPLGLVGTEVVPADRIWRDVICEAIGEARVVTVVCPQWWSAVRIDRVRAAAQTVASCVVVRSRAVALRAVAGAPEGALVELGERLVRITRPGTATSILRRADVAVVDGVVAQVETLGGTETVLIDAPSGVPGAVDLATEIQVRLERAGITSRMLSCADLLGTTEQDSPRPAASGLRNSVRGRAVVLVVASGAVATAVGLGLSGADAADSAAAAAAEPSTDRAWLVEGQVAVQIPARWTVERVVAGSGSARVQVVSPDDPGQVIHLTQSPVPPQLTLGEAARSLRDAATRLPNGVIVDFDDAGVSAGRPAVRYREVRDGRTVDWSVLLDGPVRIAVGCQGAVARTHCDSAIRSAHRAG